MGLFSRKKKEPKIPFPEGKPLDERSLNFSPGFSADKVIEPDALKKAAGVHGVPLPPPPAALEQEMPPMPPPMPKVEKKVVSQAPDPFVAPAPIEPVESEHAYAAAHGPLYVKKDVYVQLLEDINDVVKQIGSLKSAGSALAKSEYNEDAQVGQLKRQLKVIHDKILRADTVLFKAAGE